MSDAFFAAYSALDARMKIVDVIANNLANSETTGFKRDFGRILESEHGFDVGTAVDLTPGDFIATKNDLDVAIQGSGFFAVQTPQGVRYTRAGNFATPASALASPRTLSGAPCTVPITIPRNRSCSSAISSAVFPFTSCVMIEADACEIEQPCPANLRS